MDQIDGKIKLEISRTSPDVPFRAQAGYTHYTWAKTFHSRPELYIRPESLEEIQKIVDLARKCRRRIVVVGCGHSPSDLTCTSSWLVNLDNYSRLLDVSQSKKTVTVEGGIRLSKLNEEAVRHGLIMHNLGSIDEQSIVGAISTGTHGSSLKHGLMSESVRSLRIVLANGHAVRCSADQNPDLFRAALISLGALGIITEVEFELTDACNIEWEQTLLDLDYVLDRWDKDLWTRKEFTRCWWMPYSKRMIQWSAEKTTKPLRDPPKSWYGGALGFHIYHNLLWLSNYFPSTLPTIEWFVFGMQYGFSPGQTTSAVQPQHTGLLMDCLYSQFVNEWAIPLRKGPEAIRRLSAWINREPGGGDIPFSAEGLYVHCPIEVRVSDTTFRSRPRPLLDNTCSDGPTLYLNATLYRPYLQDPPCRARYYEAFEWLMREMGGIQHYAKNFTTFASTTQIRENVQKWKQIRHEADPDGMFLGEWHARNLELDGEAYPLMEREVRREAQRGKGQFWEGAVRGGEGRLNSEEIGAEAGTRGKMWRDDEDGERTETSSAAESFDMMHSAEAEKSVLL